MVRLIRFMSEEELTDYLKGKTLVNNTKFEQNGSKGFCFFNAEEIDPITAQHILVGVATMEFMVEFMVEERTFEQMTKAQGRYHKPGKPLSEVDYLPEYSITKYNRRDFYAWQIWRLYIQTPVFGVSEEMGKTIIRPKEKRDGKKPKNRQAF